MDDKTRMEIQQHLERLVQNIKEIYGIDLFEHPTFFERKAAGK